MLKTAIGAVLLPGMLWCQAPYHPAARQHVKMIDGQVWKFTSKLKQVVELNFTLGESHPDGKRLITQALDRIAAQSANDGKAGIAIKRICSEQGGSIKGMIPDFTRADLLAGQVIVANNIGYLNHASFPAAKRLALRQAIETEGLGFLGVHGTGEAFEQPGSWDWFNRELFPLQYGGHGNRVPLPVYKNLPEFRHIVLENVLEAGMTLAQNAPNGVDSAGGEILATGVKVRSIKNQMTLFHRDISQDPAYRNRVTVLLKSDMRSADFSTAAAEYRRKGGNTYTYLYQVGKGMTSYFPAGHEKDELTDPTTGFDGGVGDLDRYLAQTLYFLAGYRSELCDSTCNGLPLVDKEDHLVQQISDPSVRLFGSRPSLGGIRLDPLGPAFISDFPGPYRAVVTDPSGRVLASAKGNGPINHRFKLPAGWTGLCILSVNAGKGRHFTQKYPMH